jgi:hypothetical protein
LTAPPYLRIEIARWIQDDFDVYLTLQAQSRARSLLGLATSFRDRKFPAARSQTVTLTSASGTESLRLSKNDQLIATWSRRLRPNTELFSGLP